MSPRKRVDEGGINAECTNAECSGLVGPSDGKLSTSVAQSRPRYWRFSVRTRASLTSATLTTPRARRGASRASHRVRPGADTRLPSPFATSTRSLLARPSNAPRAPGACSDFFDALLRAMMAIAVRERLVRPDDLLDQLVTNH